MQRHARKTGAGARLLRGLLLFAVGYSSFVLSIFLGSCADSLLLHPSTAPISSTRMQRRALPHRGGVLEVWSYRTLAAAGGSPKLWVLEFVGNAERAEHGGMLSITDWGTFNVEVWTVNYPGYGGSSGRASLQAIPPAALAVYDRLAAAAKGAPIIVVGNSLGTAAALHVAANRRIAGVVLRNPPPVQNMILMRYGWWNLWLAALPVAWQVPDELNSLDSAPRVTAPAVFILSREDDVVPFSYQHKVLMAYAGPRQVLSRPDGRHNSPLSTSEQQRFRDLLHQLLRSALRDPS